MAENPYVNKVEFGNRVVMDISDTTAQSESVESGKVFYSANGKRTTGSGVLNVIDDTAGAGDTDKAWSADKLSTEFDKLAFDSSTNYTKMPDGTLIVWGNSSTNGTLVAYVQFGVLFANTDYSVIVTPIENSNNVKNVTAIIKNTYRMDVNFNNVVSNFYWMAIGKWK